MLCFSPAATATTTHTPAGGDATQLEMTQPSAEDAEMARNIAEYVLAQGGFEGGFEDGFEGFGDPDALDMYGEDADGWGEAAVGVGFGFDAEFDDTGFEAMSVHDNIQVRIVWLLMTLRRRGVEGKSP